MGYEIELKARVDNWEELESILTARCGQGAPVKKKDRYFCGPNGDIDQSSFRLREEEGASSTVTFKEKRLVDGVERNREREFTVDDSEAFLELTKRTGCSQYLSKSKTGFQFRFEDMTIELVHVGGLGDFLEVEIIVDGDDEALHEAAAARVRRFFRETGLSEESIEPLPYALLLRRLDVGEDGASGG